MPNIAQYDAPQLGLQPDERGVSAAERVGRHIDSAYSQAATAISDTGRRVGSAIETAGDVAVKAAEHQEISKGSAAFATFMQNKEQQWNDTVKNADPNDPTLAQKFLNENLNPDLDKMKDSFLTEGGQKWAEQHIEALRNHMATKTAADMSRMAGDAVVVNTRQTINALSNSVRADPSSLDFSLKTLDSSVEGVVGSSPTLTGTDAARVRMEVTQRGKEEIVKSAALGYIQRTGAMPKWATDPKYAPYINGSELKQFEQTARMYNRMGEAEARAERAERDYNNRTDFNAKVNALEASTMPEKVGDQPQLPSNYWEQLKQLSTHPGAALEPGRLKTMVTNGEAITARLGKPEPLGPVSHAATMDLLRDIRSGKVSDTTPIYDAYQNNKLNNADFKFLTDEFRNLRTPQGQALESDRKLFMQRFSRVIDGSMTEAGTPSILGAQRLYDFEMTARRQEDDLRKKGLDPHLVYDPTSQYFFGKPENIAKFHVSMTEAQQYDKTLRGMDKAAAAGAAPAAPAFKPPPDWQFSPSRRQYRDPQGRIHDIDGNLVK